MKVGDILYFVDIENQKVSKHKIKDIKINNSFTLGNYDVLSFSGIKAVALRTCIYVNPKDYSIYQSTFRNSNKHYLVFTEAKTACAALTDYVFPLILDRKIKSSDKLRDSYFESIEQISKIESEFKKIKESLEKKCNIIESKFV